MTKETIINRIKTLEKEQKDMELLKLIPSLVSRIQFLEEALEDQTGIYIPKRAT